jgi:orotate phosphoribosyltransferase-like protein
MSDKLNIGNEMRMFDRKVRSFYDDLTEEERKKFSPYLMIRWGSAVEGSKDLQEFYVIATNERLNKHFFEVNTARHKKLQWLLATTVSPDMGTHRHIWIASKKKENSSGEKRKALQQLFPHYKDDEIEVMTNIVTQKELKEYQQNLGEDVK